MITTFENRCVLKFYVIVLIPIFDTTYKGEIQVKYTCEVYITNWSYSKKVGIVFAVYQRMRSKETSWAEPRLQSDSFPPFIFIFVRSIPLLEISNSVQIYCITHQLTRRDNIFSYLLIRLQSITFTYPFKNIIDLFQPETSTFSTRTLIWVHFKTMH